MTKGARIGRGRTAEIFEWGDGQALKLFESWCPPAWVDHEAEIGRKVHATGLPVPAVEGIIELDGRRGIIYERVAGPSMLAVLASKPWLVAPMAHMLAELQATVHATRVSGFPSRREDLERRIRAVEALSAEQKNAVLLALSRLPDGDALLHGDLHPDNILLTARGPVIIDWIAATQGHPLADAARTRLLLDWSEPMSGGSRFTRWIIETMRALFRSAYLRRYLALRPDASRDGMEAWMLPAAAARLIEGIKGEENRLLAVINRELEKPG